MQNWKDLNEVDNDYGINKELSNAEKYEKAIQYQLNYLSEFIANNGTANDIFILIGDHQPFNIGQIDNRLCPVHIISKDENFTNAFQPFGFVEGLFSLLDQPIEAEENKVHHAGIQSMLVQVLSSCYGSGSEAITYYPKGINVNKV